MLVRRERVDDAAAVALVHRSAFASDDEAALAAELRRSGAAIAALSLVAEVGDDGVCGHVVCSRGDLGGVSVPALGPIGVVPRRQGEGIGLALMHTVIGAADALGVPVVVLLGDPGYYRRFGFRAAHELGIEPPVDSWRTHFQARVLSAYDPSLRGTYRYAEPFG
jgi:putative acetyltransferase